MSQPIIENSKILVVDDTPANLDILFTYLNASGFKVSVAESGLDAIEQTKSAKPDIILLDIMMPGLNGFETCRRLKNDTETKNIPVIFMTALTGTIDKVEGFEVGAVDYVTKPLQYKEILARITTHLTIRKLQMDLQAQNEHLQAENVKHKRVQDALRESRER